jgi:hypothetical protein
MEGVSWADVSEDVVESEERQGARESHSRAPQPRYIARDFEENFQFVNNHSFSSARRQPEKPNNQSRGRQDLRDIPDRSSNGHQNRKGRRDAYDSRSVCYFSSFFSPLDLKNLFVSTHSRNEPSGPKEMGKVCLLKGDFGFIRCCYHEEDLFFHFSELEYVFCMVCARIKMD